MLDMEDKKLSGYTFIDLFAGLGGFRLALESLGAKCVFSSEWNEPVRQVYLGNFGDLPDGDITKIDEKDVPDHDILCAGFPCFPAGVLVQTDCGMKAIEDIELGDMVLTHKGRYRRVLATGVKDGADTVVLHGQGTDGIECTPEHPFYAMNTANDSPYWEDACRMAHKKWYKVESDVWYECEEVLPGRKNITVYNMEVEEDNSYTVDGIAVHNCQAFSISGKRLGFEDSRGTLFFDVARIVREKRPKAVFLENVKNFASHDGGRTLEVVKNTMEDMGYSFHYKVMNALDYGVPQKRERIYMVCLRGDIEDTFAYPEPFPLEKFVEDYLLPEGSEELEHLFVERDDMVIEEGAEDKENAAKALRVGIVNKGCQGERIYSPKGCAITFSAYGGGAFSKTGGYLVGGRARKLHPRECARIMGFPDTYRYAKSHAQAYKQFGNSVAVEVLQQIADRIADVLEDDANEGK